MSHASLKSSYPKIEVNAIRPSPFQARKEFDEELLQGLAASMKEQGLIEPIVVRPAPAKDHAIYELISGERRLRAARLLGWTSIEARIIATQSDAEAAIKGFIENLQREDLNPIEEAEAFQALARFGHYKKQRDLAKAVGKDPVYLSRSLSLLNLSQTAIQELRQRNFSREHGIELLRINDGNQQKIVVHKLRAEGWSVKETRRQIDALLRPDRSRDQGFSGKAISGPLVDPLEKVWEPLRVQEGFAPDLMWDVQYKEYAPVPGKGTLEGWVFFAHPIHENSARVLAAWFRQMATALEGKTPLVEESQVMNDRLQLDAKIATITAQFGDVRLPKTPQEEKELEALAEQGTPRDVFAWIYGKNNPRALMIPAEVSWKEFGQSPKEAVRTIVEGLKSSAPQIAPDPALDARIARRKAERELL